MENSPETNVTIIGPEDLEETIPVVKAVAGFDGIEDQQPLSAAVTQTVEMETSEKKDKVTVQVNLSAPSILPGGCILYVTTSGGRQLRAKVPPEGVTRGQQFTAEAREITPIKKRWSDEILDCANPRLEGSNVLCLALFCPTTLWAMLIEKLHGGIPGRLLVGLVVVLYVLLYVLYVLLYDAIIHDIFLRILGVILLIIGVCARRIVRTKYQIQGNTFCDCYVNTLCGCCTALQAYRHMKRSGDAPMICCDRPTYAQVI